MVSSKALANLARACGDNDMAERIEEETKSPFKVEVLVDCLSVTIKLTTVDDFDAVNSIIQNFLAELREDQRLC